MNEGTNGPVFYGTLDGMDYLVSFLFFFAFVEYVKRFSVHDLSFLSTTLGFAYSFRLSVNNGKRL